MHVVVEGLRFGLFVKVFLIEIRRLRIRTGDSGFSFAADEAPDSDDSGNTDGGAAYEGGCGKRLAQYSFEFTHRSSSSVSIDAASDGANNPSFAEDILQ